MDQPRDGALEVSGRAWQEDGNLSARYRTEALKEMKEPSGVFFHIKGDRPRDPDAPQIDGLTRGPCAGRLSVGAPSHLEWAHDHHPRLRPAHRASRPGRRSSTCRDQTPADFGYDRALAAFDASLDRLGLEHVDLYLLHWPDPDRRLEAWRALETLASGGRCRAIGVSNFTVAHLEELLNASTVVPAVNQIELHPFWQRAGTVAFCQEHGIAVEAWGPLVKGQRLADPALNAIADDSGVSAAQLLIRWSLQKGYICIPKSANRERIAQNSDVFRFQLDDVAMARIDALEEGYRTAAGWDPTREA